MNVQLLLLSLVVLLIVNVSHGEEELSVKERNRKHRAELREKAAELSSRVEKQWNQAQIDFLASKENDKDVISLPSGVMYKVLNSGPKVEGKKPQLYKNTRIHYSTFLVDGKEVDSSYRRGKPTLLSPNNVVTGFREALLMMNEGDKWEVYLPPRLAYGEFGDPERVPPNSALFFRVEILESNVEFKGTEKLFFALVGPLPLLPITIPVWQGIFLVIAIILQLKYNILGLHEAGKVETCDASHILVESEKKCKDLLEQINSGKSNFEILAREHSICTSSKKRGNLGTFMRGMMVKEFEDLCFDPKTPIQKVLGPLKTSYGYHLIFIESRRGPAFDEKQKSE